MRNSLHPKLLVGLLAVMLAAPAFAQYTGQAKTSKMRAVGILRIDPAGKARLFPVTLFIDGKYYDARFYEANPVPFAIAGNVFYQAEKDGTKAGNFVVQTDMHTSLRWWAEGIWKPGAGDGAQVPTGRSQSNWKDERPVLHRAPAASSDSSADRSPSAGKRTAGTSSDAVQQAEAGDPNRPTLRHGKSEQVQPDIPVSSAGGIAVTSAAAPTSSASDNVLLAIADVGNIDSRPYLYKSSPEERRRDVEALKSLASEAIRKAAKQRADLRGVDATRLDEVDVHIIDPDYGNRPVEVFTATITGAQSKFWLPPGSIIKSPPKVNIVLVARKDSTGRLNQIFVTIADPSMLDVRPSLQYLGSVDADGSGRAQLLFRKQVDVSSFSYVLYRATPYELVMTFETKAAQE